MTQTVKLSGQHLTKRYEMTPNRLDKIKGRFQRQPTAHFWALRGVDFVALAGESVAVIGTNGSGKSTLMNVISDIVQPTTGQTTVNGTVSLVAVKSGLQGKLSGRANIILKGLLLGMTEAEITAKLPEIIAFSELGVFIDQPVKTYSSGMKSKLGFAISVAADPDILIVDEALSVGDAAFTKKSLAKLKDFQQAGKTIFFVSHLLGQVAEMADRVLWLERGQVRQFGATETVLQAYRQAVAREKGLTEAQRYAERQQHRAEQRQFNLVTLYSQMRLQVPDPAQADAQYQSAQTVTEAPQPSRKRWSAYIAAVVLLIWAAILIVKGGSGWVH